MASNQQKIAELLENISENDALIAYEKAYDYYAATDHSENSSTKILLKIAELSTKMGLYEKAATHYESVAKYNMKVNTPWNATTNLLHAGICKLCQGDIVEMDKSLNAYCKTKPDFVKSDEYRVLDALFESYKSFDTKGFAEAMKSYKFVNWDLIILKVLYDKLEKSVMEAEDDLT